MTYSDNSKIFYELNKQIKEYFSGRRTCFDIETSPEHSLFQKKVLKIVENGQQTQNIDDISVRQTGSKESMETFPVDYF